MPGLRLGHSAPADRGEQLLEVVHADARHEPARVRVVLGGEEELEHDGAATEDEPSSVPIRHLEPEAAVEVDRRVERTGRKVRHRAIGHEPNLRPAVAERKMR